MPSSEKKRAAGSSPTADLGDRLRRRIEAYERLREGLEEELNDSGASLNDMVMPGSIDGSRLEAVFLRAADRDVVSAVLWEGMRDRSETEDVGEALEYYTLEGELLKRIEDHIDTHRSMLERWTARRESKKAR